MTFADNINRICKERGTKLTPMVNALGYSSSKATAINNGSIPKESDLNSFAEFLECSVADFFYDGKSSKNTLSEDEKDIIRIFRNLSRRERHEFMIAAYRFESDSEIKKGTAKNAG